MLNTFWGRILMQLHFQKIFIKCLSRQSSTLIFCAIFYNLTLFYLCCDKAQFWYVIANDWIGDYYAREKQKIWKNNWFISWVFLLHQIWIVKYYVQLFHQIYFMSFQIYLWNNLQYWRFSYCFDFNVKKKSCR